MSHDALKGKTILITRAQSQTNDMSRLIKSYGGGVLTIPLLDFVLNPVNELDTKKMEKLDLYQWIIFTSANAVHFFFDHLNNRQLTLPSHIKIAVVGKKTAAIIESFGLTVKLIPEHFTTEGLLTAFSSLANQPQNILFPVGQLAKPSLRKGLEAQGHRVTSIVVYHTVLNRGSVSKLNKAVNEKTFDIVTFTSPSSVQFFIDCFQGDNWHKKMRDIVVACIGTITEQAARDHGFIKTIVPNEYTTTSLIEAIVRYYHDSTNVNPPLQDN